MHKINVLMDFTLYTQTNWETRYLTALIFIKGQIIQINQDNQI